MTIVNKSFLRAFNCTFDSIDGLLLYVSGSSLIIDGSSTFRDTINDDKESALISIDTSDVSLA